MRIFTLAVAAFAALAASGLVQQNARADILYDNTLKSDSGGFPITAGQSFAERFNSGPTALTLDTVTYATAFINSGGAGNFELDFYTDTSNHPGTLVSTLFSGSTTSKGMSSTPQALSFSNLAQPLSPNTNYWIALTIPSGQPTNLAVSITEDTTGSGVGFQADAAGSADLGANWSAKSFFPRMEITAVAAPEPASLGLMASGMVLLGMRRRTRAR